MLSMSTIHPDVSPLDYLTPAKKKKRTGPNWLLRIGVTAVLGIAAVSVLLPSLCKPRESANRAKCASNLHQIGLAISLYASENAGQYPESFASLMTQEQLTAAVFVCPSSNDQAASGADLAAVAGNLSTGHHLSYIYAGRGLTTATVKPETVIAYEPLMNHQEDGIDVLYGDGHAEWVSRQTAKALIAKLSAPATQP
jgi:hypothetical protein